MNNRCTCGCHKKSNNLRMYSFEIDCECCSLHDVRYINDDGTIDNDLLAQTKVDRWNLYRKRNYIEWIRSKKSK